MENSVTLTLARYHDLIDIERKFDYQLKKALDQRNPYKDIANKVTATNMKLNDEIIEMVAKKKMLEEQNEQLRSDIDKYALRFLFLFILMTMTGIYQVVRIYYP